ncbi:MAG TPA: hypothetical protein VFT29_20675 [Gemmatimonadaceae bacterium]|nr:hypothetical protein [Gemmatimonadaceae bacterium]
MFVELIESLRCPRHLEGATDSPHLVASATRSAARHIVDGVLGCPVCGAEFPIVNGVAHFDRPARPTPEQQPGEEEAMRLAAFLELTDARWYALLHGRWGAHADLIHRLAETRLVLVNPPPNVPGDVAAAIVETRDVLPFAPLSARGAALDEGASPELVRSAVRAVRSRGRVVGPASLPIPDGVTVVARDDHLWVGEKIAVNTPPRLVEIASGRKRSLPED